MMLIKLWEWWDWLRRSCAWLAIVYLGWVPQTRFQFYSTGLGSIVTYSIGEGGGPGWRRMLYALRYENGEVDTLKDYYGCDADLRYIVRILDPVPVLLLISLLFKDRQPGISAKLLEIETVTPIHYIARGEITNFGHSGVLQPLLDSRRHRWKDLHDYIQAVIKTQNTDPTRLAGFVQ